MARQLSRQEMIDLYYSLKVLTRSTNNPQIKEAAEKLANLLHI